MKILSASVAILSCGVPAFAANTWYVDASATPPGLGTLASPYTSLQHAVDAPATQNGDTIFVATGTYTGTGSNVITATRAVNLSGGWNASFTTQAGTSTIDAQSARRAIQIQANAPTTIVSFTVSNGLVSMRTATSPRSTPRVMAGRLSLRLWCSTLASGQEIENLTLAGKPVRTAEFFKTNEFVDSLAFPPSTAGK